MSEELTCPECGARYYQFHRRGFRWPGESRENYVQHSPRFEHVAGDVYPDDVDDHLTDVIEGLRHHADEIEEFLQEEYYR